MKKILYIIVIAVLAASCKDQDDIYKEYRVSNGTTYPGKPTSLECFSGEQRVEIQWQRGNDPSIAFARVYWNNYTDSTQIAIPEDADIIRCSIEPLAEGSYSFNIKTFTSSGTASVPVEVMGKVYGNSFRATLHNRTARSILYDPNTQSLSIAWVGQLTNEVECILTYVNAQNATVQESIPLDATSTVIEGFQRGLSINSIFVPPFSIDTFRIEPVIPKITMPILFKTVPYGINLATPGLRGTVLTEEDGYVKLEATTTDPSVNTLPLPEAINLPAYFKVYFCVEYQTNWRITNAEVFYAVGSASGSYKSPLDMEYENTGLDPADADKWKIFRYDLAAAFLVGNNWGSAAGHFMRYDYVNNGNAAGAIGTILYVKKMWFDAYILQEVDL